MRGIVIRQELTDEYKNFKGLQKENLRDHMNDLELIFTILDLDKQGNILGIELLEVSKRIPQEFLSVHVKNLLVA